MVKEQISLYYREGNSDKEYHVQLVSTGDLFAVNFQYGRRGSTLSESSKTAVPVSFEQARKIYDKLVKEKKGKGYTEGLAGTPYAGSAKAGQQSGNLPQLLNQIDEATALQLIEDPEWVMQEKKDGRRLMLERKALEILGSNREGMFVAIPSPVAHAAACLNGNFIMDGEAVGDMFCSFDLLEAGGENLRRLGVVERHRRLSSLFQSNPSGIDIVPLLETADDKRQQFHRLRLIRAEGVVFKRANSPYVPGRPNSGGDHLKFKFTADATCFVRKINSRRSVEIGMEGDCGALVGVGNVTIPVNHEIPGKGDLINVRYLYAYRGGSLYQPVYLGSREGEGLRKADNIATLKDKQDGVEDDSESDPHSEHARN
ncbi:MAG TPA: WGR domain-containing protein [Candidatus Angelobacter sp.]|nr:WGR domain-containing protein [Candidatus Angelobacter sp.]